MRALLLFALTFPLSADIITWHSNAATPNNGFATTIDLGLSDIMGADDITITPNNGTVPVGFYATGQYYGIPYYGSVVVEAAPGSQVQFDGTWLTQDLSSGPSTFVLPIGLLLGTDQYSFAVFTATGASEIAAFSGYIETSNTPEPATIWMMAGACFVLWLFFRASRKTR